MIDYKAVAASATDSTAIFVCAYKYFHADFNRASVNPEKLVNMRLSELLDEPVPANFMGVLAQKVRIAILTARDEGLLEISNTGWISLTEKAFLDDNVNDLIVTRTSLGAPNATDEIPASNRFVNREDNISKIEEADSALLNLEEIIQTSNDFPFDSSERAAVVEEVRGLRLLLQNSKIRINSIWHATRANSTLQWLASQTASGAVQSLAAAAVAALVAILAGLV